MKVRFQGRVVDLAVHSQLTFREFRARILEEFGLEYVSIRLLAAGKSVPEVPDEPIANLFDPTKPVMVLATPQKQISELHIVDAENVRQARLRARAAKTLGVRSRRPTPTTQKPEYTFSDVKALPYGDQVRALTYLQRIRDDKAVQALMAKHRLRVGLLTELDPLTNTEIDHRTLGLNKNAGDVIYLRIRTDDYEGFCNYNEVMLVLCHELAHNTHHDHSPQFWSTCRQYEREIKELDPWKGGHSLQ